MRVQLIKDLSQTLTITSYSRNQILSTYSQSIKHDRGGILLFSFKLYSIVSLIFSIKDIYQHSQKLSDGGLLEHFLAHEFSCWGCSANRFWQFNAFVWLHLASEINQFHQYIAFGKFEMARKQKSTVLDS